MNFDKIINHSYLKSMESSKNIDIKQFDDLSDTKSYEDLLLQSHTLSKKKKNKKISYNSTDKNYIQVMKHLLIPKNNNDFILKTFYRIVESRSNYTYMYYILTKMIHEYYFILIHQDDISYQSHIVSKLDSIHKLNDLLKKRFNAYNIDITHISINFSDFVKMADNDNLIFFKKYCTIQNIHTYSHIKNILYKNIDLPLCYTSGSYRDIYNRFIIDQHHTRYDPNIKLQKNEYSYYQTICQPIEWINRNNSKMANFYNNQTESLVHEPNNYICEGNTKHISKGITNINVDDEVKHDDNIYMPKLTNNPSIPYAKGLRKSLQTDFQSEKEFQLHILDKQNYSPPESGEKLTLLEQIKETEQLTQRLCRGILLLRNNILTMKSYLKQEYSKICPIHTPNIVTEELCIILKKLDILDAEKNADFIFPYHYSLDTSKKIYSIHLHTND